MYIDKMHSKTRHNVCNFEAETVKYCLELVDDYEIIRLGDEKNKTVLRAGRKLGSGRSVGYRSVNTYFLHDTINNKNQHIFGGKKNRTFSSQSGP